MGTRSVRLDEESETILEEIGHRTGMSASQALKQGLRALRQDILLRSDARPFDVFERLDLGPGGYASAPSDDTRAAARKAIRRKHRR